MKTAGTDRILASFDAAAFARNDLLAISTAREPALG
jgi:hypothetical protein